MEGRETKEKDVRIMEKHEEKREENAQRKKESRREI